MILLLLTACFVRYEPIRDAARAERTGATDAEERWEAVLDRELLVGEWKQARRRLCSLREARIDAARTGLDPDIATYDEVVGLRGELTICPGAGPLKAELLALEQAIATRELRPLLARTGVHPYDQLREALPHTRHLTPSAAAWDTLNPLREQWVAQLRERRERMEGPAARALFDDLLREAGEDAPTRSVEVADRSLMGSIEALTVTADASCEAVRPEEHPDTSLAGVDGIRASLHLSDCTAATRHGRVEVEYPVTRYRQELQDVEVRVPYTTATTVTNVNCYTSLQYGGQVCTSVGTYTKYETTYETHLEKRWVDVPYTVMETRLEDRYTQTGGLRWGLEVTTLDGTRALDARRVRTERRGTTRPSPSSLWREQIAEVLPQARSEAVALARELRLDALARIADAGTPEGIEALLTLEHAGRPLDDATRSELAHALDLPETALARERLAVGDVAPRPLEAESIAYRFPRVEQGLVRYGFSPLLVTSGFGTMDGGDFDAHTTPKNTGIHAQYELNGSISTGRAANGLALHAMPQIDLHVGWRSNSRQTFTELPLGADDDREPRQAQGVRAGVALLAGFRSTGIGLFAGLHPQAHFTLSGFYKNGGTGLPLAARLEVRPVPRRPLFVNAWYGDVRDPADEDWGLRIALPIGERLWFTAERSTNTGRTELRGVNDRDILNGGPRPLQRTFAGVSYGF